MKPSIIVHGGAGGSRFGKDDKRFGQLLKAVDVGIATMKKGSSLDGAQSAVNHLEESGLFNCGRGACLTAEGKVELDGAVMWGKGLAGAGVGYVTCTYNPVSLARWVMENTEHVLIAGERCVDYARLAGLRIERLRPSSAAAAKFAVLKEEKSHAKVLEMVRKLKAGETVGAVAVGSDGIPAAAVSTGGRWLKLPGRVGDSAILGSGIFADSKTGAACATGTGEDIIKCALSFKACEFMGENGAPEAAKMAIRFITRSRGKGTAGIITVDLKGRVGASFNTEAMPWAWYDQSRGRPVGNGA
ncbi:MAG TPA: isoaspartyl peptidase/L-asparaginase [Nitrososphaerales archaeon]|nr:isoaspartyl peptidase/L-asparaginase [Nitrososphaerales archaeon]